MTNRPMNWMLVTDITRSYSLLTLRSLRNQGSVPAPKYPGGKGADQNCAQVLTALYVMRSMGSRRAAILGACAGREEQPYRHRLPIRCRQHCSRLPQERLWQWSASLR